MTLAFSTLWAVYWVCSFRWGCFYMVPVAEKPLPVVGQRVVSEQPSW